MIDTSYVVLRLFIMRGSVIVDVVDARPASFYSYLPDWLAQYPDCTIHARVYDAEHP